MILNQRT